MKIMHVVGARPNFMKIAPILEAFSKLNAGLPEDERTTNILLHTGQHYGKEMSGLFFEELGLPRPDIELNIGSNSHARQTADIMTGFEQVLLKERPDYVLVVGDVNSTIACALTASKLGIGIIHVEAGLRSFDRTMPEEINRVLTDAISDMLFTTEKGAAANLLREGIDEKKIHFVGNVMVDTLLKNLEAAKKSSVLEGLGLRAAQRTTPYALCTLHRPSNVDSRNGLENILEAIGAVAKELPVIFPMHPRTRKMVEEFGLWRLFSGVTAQKGIRSIEPLGYLEFLDLMANSRLVLTDSGGVQEETTVLGLPCVTMRNNTERPVTVTQGTNRLAGTDKNTIIVESLKALNNKAKGCIPELWDGKAAERIAQIILHAGAGARFLKAGSA